MGLQPYALNMHTPFFFPVCFHLQERSFRGNTGRQEIGWGWGRQVLVMVVGYIPSSRGQLCLRVTSEFLFKEAERQVGYCFGTSLGAPGT